MLSVEQARDHSAALVEHARRAGGDAADVVYHGAASTEVHMRLGALESVERSEGEEIGLRVFVGQRSASAATSDFTAASFSALVERVVAMAREAPEDPYAALADPAALLRGDPPHLDLADATDWDPAHLRDLALEAEDAARAVPGVSNSEGGGASATRSVFALATSNGFAHAYEGTGYSVSASVLAGDGGAMQRDYAHHSARHRADLETPTEVGMRAGQRTVARLNPGRIESGTMPVVFDPRVSSGLIGHLVGAISGAAIARRTSFLLDKLGAQLFSPGIRIVDDPLRARGLRSRPFDGEGIAASVTDIIADGRLMTWLIPVAAGRQLGLPPTGHAARGVSGPPGAGTTNLHMAAGTLSPAALIADISDGFYVTELIGMGVNGVTGDYSRGAAGFRIERGEITTPVAEVTVAGNLIDMYARAIPANDLRFRHAVNAPTLRIDGMTIAGG